MIISTAKKTEQLFNRFLFYERTETEDEGMDKKYLKHQAMTESLKRVVCNFWHQYGNGFVVTVPIAVFVMADSKCHKHTKQKQKANTHVY